MNKSKDPKMETVVLQHYAAGLLLDAKTLLEGWRPHIFECPSCRGALIFSVLSVEAFLNELPVLLREIADRPDLHLAALWLDIAHDQRLTMHRKFTLLWHAMTGQMLDMGSKPWQDFTLLVDLRNALVHSKPQKAEARDPDPPQGFVIQQFHYLEEDLKIGKRLKDAAGPFSRALPDGAWRANASSPEAAKWAIGTANSIIRTTVEAAKSEVLWNHMDFEFEWEEKWKPDA